MINLLSPFWRFSLRTLANPKEAITPPRLNDCIDPHALPFMLAVSRAASLYVAQQDRIDPYGFCYNGIDLRHAAERWLYFAAVNSEPLFRAYASQPGFATSPLSTVESNLAPYLAKRTSIPARPLTASRLKLRLKRALDALRNEGRSQTWKENGPAIFHVTQRKFLNYLLPIASALDRPVVWLVTDDVELFEFLRERGLSAAHAIPDPTAQPCASLSRTMNDWTSFALLADAVERCLTENEPSVVVSVEGNAPATEVVARTARKLGVRTVCVQQGWSPFIHVGFQNLQYDTMCVWGDAFAKSLRPFNPRQRFVATGNHMVRLRAPGSGAERKCIGFFAQKGSRLITERAWVAFLDFARSTAESFPDWTVSVREHPGSPLTDDDVERLRGPTNLRLDPPGERALDDLLGDCAIVVSVFSTTLIEALAAGATPLIVNVTGSQRYEPDLASLGAGVEVHDFEAARLALASMVVAPRSSMSDAVQTVRARFFARDKEAALRAIKAVIEG